MTARRHIDSLFTRFGTVGHWTRHMRLDIAATPQCQDKKDLCFGIQSLLKEKLRIKVDYSKTIEEVLEIMTMKMLRYYAGDRIATCLSNLGVAMGVYSRENGRYSQLRMVNGHYHGSCKHWSDVYEALRDCVRFPGCTVESNLFLISHSAAKFDTRTFAR
jgi:hypothetical protein